MFSFSRNCNHVSTSTFLPPIGPIGVQTNAILENENEILAKFRKNLHGGKFRSPIVHQTWQNPRYVLRNHNFPLKLHLVKYQQNTTQFWYLVTFLFEWKSKNHCCQTNLLFRGVNFSRLSRTLVKNIDCRDLIATLQAPRMLGPYAQLFLKF